MSFINIYVVLIVLLNHATAISIETLQKWHNEVTNMKYNCPAPREIENSFEKTPLLLEVVDCNQPFAIYRYDFKVLISLNLHCFMSLVSHKQILEYMMKYEHGLRTPNEGINQRYLKKWADVTDKICFGRTLKFPLWA